jgi:hypothetical protein
MLLLFHSREYTAHNGQLMKIERNEGPQKNDNGGKRVRQRERKSQEMLGHNKLIIIF